MKKANKTEIMRQRVTPELKEMAEFKTERAGLRIGKKLSVSAWIEKLIKRAR